MIEQFKEAFCSKLGGTKRWQAFCFIAEKLLAKDCPIAILETGSVRDVENWSGDGCSTILWSWLAEKTGGMVCSVDISTASRPMLPNVIFEQKDSIDFLNHHLGSCTIDLLYLDSFDCFSGQEVKSAEHTLNELISVINRIPSTCLIAIDDCKKDGIGKDFLSRKYLTERKKPLLFDGYISVWGNNETNHH